MSTPAMPHEMDEHELVGHLSDDQTGLLHAAFFHLRLEEEFKKSWRFGWTYALLVIDVEGLDGLPGREGELLMLDVAGEVLTASRDIDLAARLGPARFAMLLAGTPAEGARTMVTRVMGAVLEKVANRLTLSVGLTEAPQEDLTQADEFLARAETAVRMAREQGANQVVTWNAASA